MFCLRCQAAPHWIMSFLYMKRLPILTEPWSAPVMQVPSLLPPCKLHLEKLLTTCSELSSPNGRCAHTALRKKKIFCITNLVMLLLTNYTLRLVFKYLSLASRILWQSTTHIFCFYSYWSLYLKYHLCPTVTPSKLLYPAGLSLSVSSIWTFPIPSHSPTADLDLCSGDQTSVGKAHFKADRILVCGYY